MSEDQPKHTAKKVKSGGAAPYGYRRTNDGFELDPLEAPIRKLIYELYLTHKRKSTVANILNEKGYRTRTGAKFTDSTIVRFLRDPIAKGHHKDNFIPAKGLKKYRKLKPESEWRFSAIDPIIDVIIWNQVNDLLVEQYEKPAAKKPAGLFSGYLYCSCGTKMHFPHGRRSYCCGQCNNSIEVKTLEAIFQEKLEPFKIDPDELQAAIRNAQSNSDAIARIKILDQEKSSLESEMDKLYDLYMINAISKERFSKKHKPLEDRLAGIETELKALNTESTSENSDSYTTLTDLKNAWQILSESAKRQLVELTTQRICVDQTKIRITFSISPSF